MSTPAGARTVRRHNLGLVLRQVAVAEPVARARVAELSGLTRGTVSSLVDELLAGQLVEELEADRGTPGRPANPLRLSRSGPAALGLEVNVDHAAACVLDLSGTVRVLRTVAADGPTWSSPAAGLRGVAELAHGVLAESVGLHAVGAVVALAGVVDRTGVLQQAPNLPGWAGLDVGAELSARLGVDVRAGNEADLGALGELWFGGLDGVHDFLHVSGEIGVGAGIVLDGHLFGGGGGRAGELGHVVVDPGGPLCRCGGRGCLEQVAGQWALLAAAGVSTVRALAAAAEAGEPGALGALATAGRALGLAVAGAVNLLDVPAVVLGGVHARLGRWLVPPIEAELAARSLGGARPVVLVSTLGSEAAVRGAAGSVVRALLDDPGAHLARRTGAV